MAWVPIDQGQQSGTEQIQRQQPQLPQLQIEPPRAFDVASFAGQEADRQMMDAKRRGIFVTQDMWEDARKEAYRQGTETMRQQWADYSRQRSEYQKQIQEKTIEPFLPRQMTPEEIKDASGIFNSHAAIMNLYHQNQDIGANHPYRAAYFGKPLEQAMLTETDPNVRLFDATRGGSIISLGRGLLQDTGQVAGKEQAQDLIKNLMPGPGDSPDMAARKTIDMMTMEMNGLQAKIDALPSNVNTDPLKKAYARAYADYAPLVNQSGSAAQKTYALASPQQLGWGGQSAPDVEAKKPAVQGGFTQPTNDQLSQQASGQQPQPQPATDQTYKPITSDPTATAAQLPTYPTIASDQSTAGLPEKGLDIERLKGLMPKTGGPEEDLTLPPSGAGITVTRPEEAYQ
jgi:hypothetical protein